MSGSLLVRGARQLLTLRGAAEPRRGAALQDLGIIRDGALLIVDGKIVEVGTTRRVENLTQAQRSDEIDATGRVVMPGFVDCHTQLVAAGTSQDEDAESPAGNRQMAVSALRSVSAKRLESRARQFIHGMVRHGTTLLGASSGYGLDDRVELKILRVQATLNHRPVGVTSTLLAPMAIPGALDAFSKLLTTVHRRSLVRFAGIRYDERIAGPELARAYLEAARRLGFQLKVCAGLRFRGEAIRMAVEAGAASLDGLEGAEPPDLDLLAASNTIAVLLPGTVWSHGRVGPMVARNFIDRGGAVALASNFNARTNPAYCMQSIVALGCAHLGMSAEEAICGATFNAACAIGESHGVGSLEAGKQADLIVLNTSDYRDLPRNFGVNLVHRTVKRGITIYQEGQVAN